LVCTLAKLAATHATERRTCCHGVPTHAHAGTHSRGFYDFYRKIMYDGFDRLAL
jgi:hypothetical protein